jgi:hypothetical protein
MASLQKNADANARARQDTDRNTYLTQIGRYFGAALQPLKEAVEEMKRIGANLGILSSRLNNLEIPKPEVNVDLSSIRIPTPNVTVKPIVDISTIKMPDEMNVKGWINLMGYDRGLLTNPIPVQIRDATGKPIDLSGVGGFSVSGGGGGKMDFFTIKGFSQSAYADYLNADNRLRVSVETGGSGLTDSELRASAVPVAQVSDAIWSVSVVSGSTGGTQYDDAGNADPGTGGLAMARDSAGSVYAHRVGAGTSETALRMLMATDAISSVNIVSGITLDVKQVSGSIDSVYVTGGTLSTITVTDDMASGDLSAQAAFLIGYNRANGDWDRITSSRTNADGLATHASGNLVTQSRLVGFNGTNFDRIRVNEGTKETALRTVQATDAVSSVNIVSSATITVTGSLTSSVVVGSVVGDAVDDGSAPVQMGGIARRSNPAVVADGDVVKASMDDLGRQITRPVQVRDLISTAYVSITNGTEATLKSAVAGSYLDLIYVLGTNNSDAAVTVDIRAVTAGNIATSIRIPANGTAGVSLPVPIPQDETGNNWTADLPDITGTTVTLSALFSREI